MSDSKWKRRLMPAVSNRSLALALAVAVAADGNLSPQAKMADLWLRSTGTAYLRAARGGRSGVAQAKREKRRRRNIAKRPKCRVNG